MIPAADREAYWRGYLRVLADKMELRDWSVDFDDSSPQNHESNMYASETADGQSEAGYGRKTIMIRVGRSFQDRSPENQRQTLVHELLHAHTTRTFQLMKTALREVDEQWFQVLDCAVSMDLEYAIDAIADGWSKTLPLPPAYKPGWDWRALPAGPPPSKASARKTT